MNKPYSKEKARNQLETMATQYKYYDESKDKPWVDHLIDGILEDFTEDNGLTPEEINESMLEDFENDETTEIEVFDRLIDFCHVYSEDSNPYDIAVNLGRV